uniref:Folylpoly-gamma-glutamate synthetase n=1 Tax=Anopheles maculatus TaxID=74869 RepID=A0A182T7K2_9DIPT
MHASGTSVAEKQNYENAIASLNSLQSNFSVLQASVLRKHKDDCKHINDTIKYLDRVGISMKLLDTLPAIHVSGTKGKVGIGGRYDCTNVLRTTNTVGITSLGLEHTKLLGNTLEEIAWQKAGIVKPAADVFTVPQPSQCIEVIEQECQRSKANLHIVPATLQEYSWASKSSLMEETSNIVGMNTSLAIQIATNWMSKKHSEVTQNTVPLFVTEKTIHGIDSCFWPGRLQQISYDSRKTLYLDAAHTVETNTNDC